MTCRNWPVRSYTAPMRTSRVRIRRSFFPACFRGKTLLSFATCSSDTGRVLTQSPPPHTHSWFFFFFFYKADSCTWAVGALLCWKHVSQRHRWSCGSTTDTTDWCPVGSPFSCNPLEVGISVQKYLNLVAGCILFGFLCCRGSAYSVGSFKRPRSLWLAAQNVLLHAVTTKETNSQLCGHLWKDSFHVCPPPFPFCFFFDTDHPTAPPWPASLRNFGDTPLHPFYLVCSLLLW